MGKAHGLRKRAVTSSGGRIQIVSRVQWRAWLETNHVRGSGVWVVTFKRHRGDKHVPCEDVIEETLCFGWIDSLARTLDENRTMLWFAPRKPGRGWSALNKARVEKLIAEGRMTDMGMEKITAAKDNIRVNQWRRQPGSTARRNNRQGPGKGS